MAHSLSHQGIDRATYLKIAGKDEDEVIADAKPDAEQQLRREAVLAAIVEAEAIDADRRRAARGAGAATPSAAARRPRSCSSAIKSARPRRRAAARTSRTRKALDLVVESAKPIDAARAEAREKIWTPRELRVRNPSGRATTRC